MEDYADKPYPTKAGVYAVRAGPFIAQNLINYAENKELVEYVPQTGFLSLMMTADRSCIGSKFGIGFVGNWVWELKDFIDMSFMDLFNPKYLYNDYETKGTSEPVESTAIFEVLIVDHSRQDLESVMELRLLVFAAKNDSCLLCSHCHGLCLTRPDKIFCVSGVIIEKGGRLNWL